MYKYRLLKDFDGRRANNNIIIQLNTAQELIDKNHWYRLHPDIYEPVNPHCCEILEIEYQHVIYNHVGGLIFQNSTGQNIDVNSIFFNRLNVRKIRVTTTNEIISLGDRIAADTGWSFSDKENGKVLSFPISNTSSGYFVYICMEESRNWYLPNKVKLKNDSI